MAKTQRPLLATEHIILTPMSSLLLGTLRELVGLKAALSASAVFLRSITYEFREHVHNSSGAPCEEQA